MKTNLIQKKYFLIAFLFIALLLYVLIDQKRNNSQKEYLSNVTNSMYLDYQTIYKNHKDIARLIYDTHINKPEIIRLFKNRNRTALYEKLQKDYLKLRTFNVRQLHFHLVNNDSFLRMHRPKKFGDNLSKARATVKYVNEVLEPIHGFEEGKIFNGFRFVYPLFDGKEHLGSVEISFNALVFIKKFVEQYGAPSDFFILRDVVDEKVFTGEKLNYLDSPLPSYYYQTQIVSFMDNDILNREDLKSGIGIIEQKIQEGLAFSYYLEKTQNIATFVPIRNPITGKIVSTLCFYTDTPYIEEEKLNAMILFLSTVLTTFIVLLLIYKELEYSEKLKKTVIAKTQKIKKDAELLNNVLKGSNLGYWDWYPQSNTNQVDERWKSMLGFSEDEITSSFDEWTTRVNPDDYKRVYPIIEKAIEENKPYSVEFRMRHKDGHSVWIQGSGCVMEKDEEGRPLRISGTHADITQRKETEKILVHQKEILQYQSEHDSLTGLKNRRTLNNDIDKVLRNYKNYEAPYAVLMLDIDFFKNVNDTYGHDIGDDILVELSKLLKRSFRESDKIYRAGGEEFIVLLTRVSLDEAREIADKFRLTVANHEFKTRDNVLSVTISVGLYHSSLVTLEKVREVLQLVDNALYESKSKGRNQITDVKNNK